MEQGDCKILSEYDGYVYGGKPKIAAKSVENSAQPGVLVRYTSVTASVTSPESLYSEKLVTFEESDYNQNDATGFINLWGLPDTVQALREQGKL